MFADRGLVLEVNFQFLFSEEKRSKLKTIIIIIMKKQDCEMNRDLMGMLLKQKKLKKKRHACVFNVFNERKALVFP